MENEQISMLEYAHLKKCISELERQADALQRDRLRLNKELLVERILTELRVEVELLDGFYYEKQEELIFGSGRCDGSGKHDLKPIENQTRISGGIEEQGANSSIDEQSDFQSTNPEVDIDRSQEIDDEREDICIGIISDPFGQQNETSAQFVVSCGLEDVLGFDPFVESAKGLLDLMREESENFGGRSFGQRQNSSIFFEFSKSI